MLTYCSLIVQLISVFGEESIQEMFRLPAITPSSILSVPSAQKVLWTISVCLWNMIWKETEKLWETARTSESAPSCKTSSTAFVSPTALVVSY